tara:strand:+ start:395 stop:1135 length:741 start_codon:yes stop_codon:yes gene_type:complete
MALTRQQRLAARKGKGRKFNFAKVTVPEGRARKGVKLAKKWTGGPTKPSKQDLEDAKKEGELQQVLKNKPKGGYKDTSPKPKTKPGFVFDPRGEERDKAAKKNQVKNIKIGTQKEDPKKPKLDPKPKKTEAEERAEWEKKTRNSPARRSGAWSKDELWEKQKKHRQWKKDRKEGKLKREKFDPRAPRGTQRKLVKKTEADLAAERAKKEVKAAKNKKGSIKGSKNRSEEERRNRAGFNPTRSKPGY